MLKGSCSLPQFSLLEFWVSLLKNIKDFFLKDLKDILDFEY